MEVTDVKEDIIYQLKTIVEKDNENITQSDLDLVNTYSH
jgi:hypothetical protein